MLKDGERTFYGKLDKVEQQLNAMSNNFWRISQSYRVLIREKYMDMWKMS